MGRTRRASSGPSRIAPATLGPLLLGTVLLAALLLGAGCAAPVPPGAAKVGEIVPDFDLPSLAGDSMARADLLGEGPVVLNFWATWCGPCLREIPALQELHRAGSARVVSIALDQGGEEILRPFVEKEGIGYPVLIGDIALLQQYGGSGIPFTLILDESLQVREIHRAMVSLRTLERGLRKAMEPL
ncbi:MAG: TlpA disulfide reductase family protein [Acidobacteriota bacterium]